MSQSTGLIARPELGRTRIESVLAAKSPGMKQTLARLADCDGESTQPETQPLEVDSDSRMRRTVNMWVRLMIHCSTLGLR